MSKQIEFQNKLKEIVAFAKSQESRLSIEEIEGFFKENELSKEQFTLVFDYLLAQKVAVRGYVKSEENVEKQEFSQSELEYLEEYTNDLKALKIESEGELLTIFKEIQKGDLSNLNRFTEIYLPTIVELAKEMYNGTVFVGDLVQEGNVSLMMALSSQLPQKEMDKDSVEIYLNNEVRQGIQMLMEETQELKSRDQKMVDKVARLDEAISKLTQDLGRKVSIDELVLYTEMTEEEIDEILNLTGQE